MNGVSTTKTAKVTLLDFFVRLILANLIYLTHFGPTFCCLFLEPTLIILCKKLLIFKLYKESSKTENRGKRWVQLLRLIKAICLFLKCERGREELKDGRNKG